VRRPRTVVAAPLTLIVLVAIVLGGIALARGGGEDAATTRERRDAVETPSDTATPPPGAPGALPPAFVKCMADRGFAVESPQDIHSAPPGVLQDCLGALHSGGAGGPNG
jgi:hypothetical protein